MGDFVRTLRKISPAKIDFKINEGDHLTVWFNAWKYDSTKQVWAGLADAIIRQLTDRLEQDQREQFWILVRSGPENFSLHILHLFVNFISFLKIFFIPSFPNEKFDSIRIKSVIHHKELLNIAN